MSLGLFSKKVLLPLLFVFGFVVFPALPMGVVAQTTESKREELLLTIQRLLSIVEELRTLIAAKQAQEIVIPEFTTDLRSGDTGEEVRRLQIFLNSDPDTRLAAFGPGSPGQETSHFGTLTEDAVKRFQRKHSNIFLSLYGFSSVSGVWNQSARTRANTIIRERNALAEKPTGRTEVVAIDTQSPPPRPRGGGGGGGGGNSTPPAQKNVAPVANAGSDITITLPDDVVLSGSATDDGLPDGTLTYLWSKIEGLGTVTFFNAESLTTTVSFSESGTYVLRLTVDDGELAHEDDIVVVVHGGDDEPEPPVNQAPAISSISASPSPITLPTNTVTLSVTATDDGLPQGSSISYSWVRTAGPSSGVSISNGNSATATATFSQAGNYTFRATASDGALSTNQTISVVVNAEQSGGGGEVEYTNQTYNADNTTDFLNPERGWHSDRASTGDFAGLRSGQWQGTPMTLNRWIGRLDDFRDSAISQQWLDNHAGVFQAARSAGIKLELRYAYSYNPPTNPPDASVSRIIQHINQLGPLWEANADVISSIQAGFVGRWGEWNASGYGITSGADPTDRNQIIQALLDNVPEDRMITLRYPEMGAEFFGGTSNNPPPVVTSTERFTGSEKARLGILDDSFLANHTDGGTFVTNRYTADYSTNFTSMAYWVDTSRYTVASGETVDLDWQEGNREAGPASIDRMEELNWDILNRAYSTRVINGWISSGHYDEISRRLGYRLRLTNATLPVEATSGAEVTISFTMTNDGFGKVYNPRPIDLVLRPSSGSDINVRLTSDARRDLPLGGETKTLSYTVNLPTLSSGNYNLYLALPDPSPNLEDDPRYSIRLANTGTWVGASGLNNLNTVMVVGEGDEPEPPVNQAPAISSISASPSPITLPTNTVTLSVTATDDGLPQGSSLSYSWARTAGPSSGVSISNGNSATATATFTETGTYDFQAVVSDGTLSTSQTVSVTVNEEQSGGSSLAGVGSTSTSLVDFPKTGPVTVGDWYVDIANGVDAGGRGTSVSTPVRTIEYAISQASEGQTILVRGGTYPLSSAIALNKELRLFGYGNERPVLDRGFGGTTTGNASYALRLQGGGTHFKGFTITGTPERSDALDSTRAINFESANNVVEDVWVTGNRSGNIYSFSHSNNVVQDARIWNNVMLTDVGTNSPDGISGTHSSGSVISGMAIVRSMVANAGDDGYDLYRAVNSSIIDSVSIGAGYKPDGSSTGGDGGGFKMGGGVGSGANTLRGSLAVGSRATGLNNNSTPGNSNTFENNTSYLNRQGAIGDTGTAPTWRNNIAYANTNYNTSVAGGTQQNNSWQQGTPNPLFADSVNGDLSLGSSSPYREAGTGGSHMGASDIALEIYLEWYDHPEIYNPASDSEPTPPQNQPPLITSISASPSPITLPTNTVTLSVTATDDGLPQGSSLSYSWTQTAGPSGGVSISNNTSATATATFSQAGNYTFRATASDGALSTNQTISVVVNAEQSGGGGEVEYTNQTYNADNTTDFLNPERGWYVEDGGGLGANKQNASPVGSHIQNVTLQMHYVNLSDYRNTDTLPTNFLNSLESTMQSWRTTGKKAVLRFAYNRDGTGLDAPWSRMSGHIDQLSPLLHEYKDVIGVFQAGFVGAWGEMHASSNGIAPSNADGRAFVNKILEATQGDMIVQFRTPYWMTTTLPDVEPLSYGERFTETKHARIGHYNDCIAAGQWWVTWWGDTPELTAQQEMDYSFEQGRLTSAGGETCSAGGGISQWNDAPLVISQFEDGGWDYLNSEYWTDMYDKWNNSGHLGEISRRLGYRLRLTNATLPVEATSGAEVTISFTMTNDGFGKVYNPRPIDLVLRPSSGSDINVRLTSDARRDLPLGGETKTLSYTVNLPTLSSGNYNLYLALPDPSPNLEDDPRYSIRLANTGTWVGASGLNNLNTTLTVGEGGQQEGNGPQSDFGTRLIFEDFNTSAAEGSAFWNTYPLMDHYPGGSSPWPDTTGNGRYSGNYVSAANGNMRIRMLTNEGMPRVAAIQHLLPGESNPFIGQLYGRYEVRFRVLEPAPGYKMAWLLWPDNDNWNDGEIDFPEVSLRNSNQTIWAFNHEITGTPANNSTAHNTGISPYDWHTTVIEWEPGAVRFYLDGVLQATDTQHVPNVPMHWVLQSETDLEGAPPESGTIATIDVDYIAVWKYGF